MTYPQAAAEVGSAPLGCNGARGQLQLVQKAGAHVYGHVEDHVRQAVHSQYQHARGEGGDRDLGELRQGDDLRKRPAPPVEEEQPLASEHEHLGAPVWKKRVGVLSSHLHSGMKARVRVVGHPLRPHASIDLGGVQVCVLLRLGVLHEADGIARGSLQHAQRVGQKAGFLGRLRADRSDAVVRLPEPLGPLLSGAAARGVPGASGRRRGQPWRAEVRPRQRGHAAAGHQPRNVGPLPAAVGRLGVGPRVEKQRHQCPRLAADGGPHQGRVASRVPRVHRRHAQDEAARGVDPAGEAGHAQRRQAQARPPVQRGEVVRGPVEQVLLQALQHGALAVGRGHVPGRPAQEDSGVLRGVGGARQPRPHGLRVALRRRPPELAPRALCITGALHRRQSHGELPQLLRQRPAQYPALLFEARGSRASAAKWRRRRAAAGAGRRLLGAQCPDVLVLVQGHGDQGRDEGLLSTVGVLLLSPHVAQRRHHLGQRLAGRVHHRRVRHQARRQRGRRRARGDLLQPRFQRRPRSTGSCHV
mmetsp:Transcript_24124/g.75684  ORF Transcript_24124/g.75684 Transcript_24124/m.75684 type:complete len:529 (+) Transcript_24124:521-2107(+)